MKLVIGIVCLIVSIGASAAIDDPVSTSREVIGTIEMDDLYYYFVSEDQNWSVDNCPSAKFAYININDVKAKAMYSAALSSKISKTSISFRGLCGNNSGEDIYIRINYMVF